MLWPCLGRYIGVESNLLHSGSLGSPKGVVGHSVLDHTHQIGFLSTTHLPNPLHPRYYSFFLLVSAYHCLFSFCRSPNNSLPTPTNPLQGSENLRVRLESFPGGPQPGGVRHAQQEAAETAVSAVAT